MKLSQPLRFRGAAGSRWKLLADSTKGTPPTTTQTQLPQRVKSCNWSNTWCLHVFPIIPFPSPCQAPKSMYLIDEAGGRLLLTDAECGGCERCNLEDDGQSGLSSAVRVKPC